MNEVARDLFPEEERVVVEWKAGERDTPIRFNVGPASGQLTPNTPTIMPANIAQVISEGHNVTVAGVPDDYVSAKAAVDQEANNPGGTGGPGGMLILDGPGGAPATVTSVDPAMVGGSINGGAEGAAADPTSYPATMTAGFVTETGDDAMKDIEGSEGGAGATGSVSDDEEGSEDGGESVEEGDATLEAGKALVDQNVGKLETALAAGVDLPILKAALVAEQAAGPDKERKGAVDALNKAIERHPDNKAS